MRRIDIFVSSPEDVQRERSLVERTIRAVADEFNVPITVTYSNWLREHIPLDKIAAQSANGSEDGRTWLCPCFWEYRDTELDQEYREQIPNTGSYDLVISIIWSRLGTRLSPAFVMPDGSQPKAASEYEIGWVLDQVNRTPGFPELRVYRNGAPRPPRYRRKRRGKRSFASGMPFRNSLRFGKNKKHSPRPAVATRIFKSLRTCSELIFATF